MTDCTLADIKASPLFPFKDFDTNVISFLMLELYWAQLFKELVAENDADWEVTADTEMDGNPILSVASLQNSRALRVIHKINEENKPEYPSQSGEGTHYGIQLWLDESYHEQSTLPLNELVIFADVSGFAEEEAIRFIKMHCIDLVDEKTMVNEIEAFENRVGMPV